MCGLVDSRGHYYSSGALLWVWGAHQGLTLVCNFPRCQGWMVRELQGPANQCLSAMSRNGCHHSLSPLAPRVMGSEYLTQFLRLARRSHLPNQELKSLKPHQIGLF